MVCCMVYLAYSWRGVNSLSNTCEWFVNMASVQRRASGHLLDGTSEAGIEVGGEHVFV